MMEHAWSDPPRDPHGMARQAILGVDLGGSLVRVGKVRAGEIERHGTHPISGHERKEFVLGQLYEAIDEVVDDEVIGIGCCVPSLVDVDRGIVYTVENIPSWREVPLKHELESRYGVPAYINNDANAFAVGELHFGRGRGRRNLVGLTVGTGLGAGVVVEGRLYSGANCGAGEIGAIPYRDQTIEYYCSGAFFQRQAGVRGDVLYRRARDGDAAAQRLFTDFGFELGYAIMVVLHAYDPELVVLGGSISGAFPLFEGGMRARLEEYAYPHVLERVEIAQSEIQNVAVLGSAALYLDADGHAADP